MGASFVLIIINRALTKDFLAGQRRGGMNSPPRKPPGWRNGSRSGFKIRRPLKA